MNAKTKGSGSANKGENLGKVLAGQDHTGERETHEGEAEGLGPQPRRALSITPPNLQLAKFKIIGETPLVINKFSDRVLEDMANKQALGNVAAKKTKRDPKDFDRCCYEATHISAEGWEGIPASAFRTGMIDACRLVGFPMTKAKCSIFVIADGYEVSRFNRQPLIKITKGKPERFDSAVRNETGVADIRPRPTWAPGWEAEVMIRYDADQFSEVEVLNLLARMGAQIGVGAGRPFSKDSAGCGWGTFRVATASE